MAQDFINRSYLKLESTTQAQFADWSSMKRTKATLMKWIGEDYAVIEQFDCA